MPSIDITAPPPKTSVSCPFDVQGPYSAVGVKNTSVNVKIVVSHPNGNDYPFGPVAPDDPAVYDITCNNIPSSDGAPASVTASLLRADDGKELVSQTVPVLIS